jgi:hypothetical protein
MKKTIKNTLKAILLGTSLLGTAYFSDRININDRIIHPIIYHNKETADGFTEDPFSLEKRYVINDEGEIETYFGSRETMNYYRVRRDGRTCYGFDSFVEDLEEVYETAKDKLNNIIDNIKNPEEGTLVYRIRDIITNDDAHDVEN